MIMVESLNIHKNYGQNHCHIFGVLLEVQRKHKEAALILLIQEAQNIPGEKC